MGFIGSTLKAVVSAPFKLVGEVAKAVAPAAINLLQGIANTGFEAAKMAGNTMSMMGLPLMNPLMAIGGQLLSSGAQGLQNLTNSGLNSLNQSIQGRDVPYSQYPGQLYPMPFDQRYQNNTGLATQYGNQQIYSQMYPGQTMPQSYPLNPGAVYTQNGATAATATANNGFMPTGNNMADLANSIANAPTYSPTEQALLNSIKDPQQRAIQELQMQMQKQALMCTVLTNLANMRHEMLKAVGNNLRG